MHPGAKRGALRTSALPEGGERAGDHAKAGRVKPGLIERAGDSKRGAGPVTAANNYFRFGDRANSRNSYRRLASQKGKRARHGSVTSGKP